MKRHLRAFLMCLSMFTVIPVPGRVWDDEARPLMTVYLPAVGLIIGAIWAALAYAARLWQIPKLAGAAILCAYPFAVTGGIHFDGYLDVTDAVRSWKDAEERRRIMKDPHVGSFAVLAGILLVMVQFAMLASAGEDTGVGGLILIPTVSRTASALAVTVMRPMAESEYSGRAVSRPRAVFLAVLLTAELAVGAAALGPGALAGVAALAGYGHHLSRAHHWLEGMSGDVAGYALTFGEACGIAALALI